MRIGEVAKKTGLSVQAVRFYEKRGLIGRARRTPSGYRDYDSKTLGVLLSIRRAQELGFTLKEIRLMLALHGDGPGRERAYSFLSEKIRDIDQRVAGLLKLRNELEERLQTSRADQVCPASNRFGETGALKQGRKKP